MYVKEEDMRIKKALVSNQRKRTLSRNKVRLANRRHAQFALDQQKNQQTAINTNSQLNIS